MKRLLFLLLLIPSLAWGQASMSGVSFSGCATGSGTAAGCAISDDFSSDTHLNYYSMRYNNNNSIAISSEAAYPYSASSDDRTLHDTVMSGNDHCVQADVYQVDNDNEAYVVFRGNEQSTSAVGYLVAPWSTGTNRYVALFHFSGYSTRTSIGSYGIGAGGYPFSGTLRACVSGTTISIYWNSVAADDTPVVDTTHETGTYVGIGFIANGAGAHVDNFKADASSTCMD